MNTDAAAGESLRLFLALWPSPAVREELTRRRGAWGWPQGAAVVAPERLHLTLHFLGTVSGASGLLLQEALGRVRAAAFELPLGRPEVWPGGIAVLRPLGETAALLQMHQRLGEAIRAVGLRTEERPFRPHVTLARRARAAALPPQEPVLRWRVRSYALVESRLGPGGGYRVLQRFT